ncbi:MAG: diguanylate cyclase [Spirochaetes bacterium]|nr:diguanylate cyclase [Spirochaetota bacterium]
MNEEDIQEFEDFDKLEKDHRTSLVPAVESVYKKIIKIFDSKKLCEKDLAGVKNDIYKLIEPAKNLEFFQIGNPIKNLNTYLSKFDFKNKSYKKEELDFDYMRNTILEIKKILSPNEATKEVKFSNSSAISSSSAGIKKIPIDWNKKIVICDYNGRKYFSDLKDKLIDFGYEIYFFKEIDDAKKKVLKEDIHLIIIDTDLILENDTVVPWLRKIKEKRNSFKTFYLSANNDFKTRLFAIRNEGDAFFESTIDVARIANKIEYFAASSQVQPDHILIIDDDADTLSFYAQLFQQHGMVTSVTTDPFSVFNLIADSTPDLIIIDMLMPGCNGIELATMIRQYDEFLLIPIIIYSAFDKPVTDDFEISLSSCEFINKFTDDENFVAIAINRISRTKNLKYFLERDYLTGLLNYFNICNSFQKEFVRAKRTNFPLSYAIIDIDNFKSVNDTYGHFVGDTVLKSLARLLIDRLRATDIVGRYGGEEFVVIMGNTGVQTAKKVIDTIRENFSKILHNAFGREFNVTFSCGISGFPDFSVTKVIFNNADMALYEAKKSGKNKVVVYENK